MLRDKTWLVVGVAVRLKGAGWDQGRFLHEDVETGESLSKLCKS